jgi:hypothetical protein
MTGRHTTVLNDALVLSEKIVQGHLSRRLTKCGSFPQHCAAHLGGVRGNFGVCHTRVTSIQVLMAAARPWHLNLVDALARVAASQTRVGWSLQIPQWAPSHQVGTRQLNGNLRRHLLKREST